MIGILEFLYIGKLCEGICKNQHKTKNKETQNSSKTFRGWKNWAALSGIKQGVISFPADPFYVRIYTLTMPFSNPAPKFQ